MDKFTLIEDKFGLIDKQLISSKQIKISSNCGISKLNSIAKTAILTVLAGYWEKEKITVLDNINLKKIINIDNFVNLNLNFKGKAPRYFNANITYQKLPNVTKKHTSILTDKNSFVGYDNILLLSGGIDSVAGLLYLLSRNRKVLPLWIDFGQKNRVSEKKTINLIKRKLNIWVLIIKIDLKKYVYSGWSRWKQGIIPSRNFLFVALASLLISQDKTKIWLCASKGEINSKHNDKSLLFYQTISKMLSKYTKKKIRVWTPFYKYNKAEIIYYWKNFWGSKYKIYPQNATTCYLGNNCGLCSACYYRFINMLTANTKDIQYKNNPFFDKGRIIANYYLPNFKKWGKIRKLDFLIALSKNKNDLTPETKVFFQKHYKIYYNEIKKRIKLIKKVKIN